MSRESTIRNIVDKMTIEEKAGQVLIVDFTGTTVSPHAVKVIDKFNCAGLRVQTNIRYKNRYEFENNPDKTVMEARSYRLPRGACKDFSYNSPAPRCTPEEYASILNRFKEIAMNRKNPAPLHITLDQEGAGYENFTCGNPRVFPTPMGMAAAGDEDLMFKAAHVMGRQLKAAGFNCLQNPVLDVNTNPKNPEIGIRSFSDNTDTVTRFGLATFRGLKAAGVIAMAKHFPGRGESATDAHHDLPTIALDRKEMMRVHIAPYARLFEEGLPSIMTAHTIYPGLEKEPVPSTLSKSILTGLLREELDFKGAVSTDNILMAGIVKKYEVLEASILALKAGATLVLLRDETPLVDEVYHGLVDAIKSGGLPVRLIDEAIARNLAVKYDYGLFEDGGIVDASKAGNIQNNTEAFQIEVEAAQKSVVLLRDDQNVLPLSPDTRIMLIDQSGGSQVNFNNFNCHPGIFWESMLEQSSNVISVEIDGSREPGGKDRERVLNRIEEADVIVATDYEVHRGEKLASPFLKSLLTRGKPVIIVTNSPYNIPGDFRTVLVTFADNPQSLKTAAEILYGKRRAAGKLPIKAY
jgi:beta-N-acetylhexosaminidase